jgi:CO/xanthine dehydrogenase Mo-binding subunit
VRYKGEPILAVVATSERAALEALALVRVSYDPLPAVFDVEKAMKPGAVSVNAAYPKNTFEFGKYDHQKLRFGDVEAGFAQSDMVLEERYQSPRSSTHRPRPTARSRCRIATVAFLSIPRPRCCSFRSTLPPRSMPCRRSNCISSEAPSAVDLGAGPTL